MILAPSQRMRVSQNKYIIIGVPEPAKNKNMGESTVMMDARRATFVLNQRLSRRMSKMPVAKPRMIDGSLMLYRERPKMETESF